MPINKLEAINIFLTQKYSMELSKKAQQKSSIYVFIKKEEDESSLPETCLIKGWRRHCLLRNILVNILWMKSDVNFKKNRFNWSVLHYVR